MANEINIYRGDTHTLTVSVTDSGGATFDLTGYTMTLTAKADKKDLDAAAVLSKTATIASPTTGVGVFTLAKEDTSIDPSTYYYGIQINSITEVKTIIVSTLTIMYDITTTSV
jgi:hypothetical protein